MDHPAPHDECRNLLTDELKAGALHHYAEADRLYRHKATRGNARINRRMAVALGWAAGWLLRGTR